MVELAGRYSDPKTEQALRALLSLKAARDADLFRDRNSSRRQKQRRLIKVEIGQVIAAYIKGSSETQFARIWGTHRTTISGHIRRSGVPRGR